MWRDSLALKSHAVAGHRAQRRRAPGSGRGPGAAGRLDEAEPYLKQAAEINPDAADPLLDLADLEARRGLNEQALALYRELADRHPEHARAHANLGLALVRAGQADRSSRPSSNARSRWVVRAASASGRWAGVELALARLCEAASDLECARLHYGRGLSDRPDDTAARQRLEALTPLSGRSPERRRSSAPADPPVRCFAAHAAASPPTSGTSRARPEASRSPAVAKHNSAGRSATSRAGKLPVDGVAAVAELEPRRLGIDLRHGGMQRAHGAGARTRRARCG